MIPKHFIYAYTPVTKESMFWITTVLVGRYGITRAPNTIVFTQATAHPFMLMSDLDIPCFEDSREAVLYELTWSGNN